MQKNKLGSSNCSNNAESEKANLTKITLKTTTSHIS